MHEYSAVCLEVINGNTIRVDLDLGFDIRQKMTLRLYGIKALGTRGESGGEQATAAKDFLKQSIEGQPVIIRTYKDKDNKHGQLLADVFNGPSISVNQQMLTAGLATAYFGGKRI